MIHLHHPPQAPTHKQTEAESQPEATHQAVELPRRISTHVFSRVVDASSTSGRFSLIRRASAPAAKSNPSRNGDGGGRGEEEGEEEVAAGGVPPAARVLHGVRSRRGALGLRRRRRGGRGRQSGADASDRDGQWDRRQCRQLGLRSKTFHQKTP